MGDFDITTGVGAAVKNTGVGMLVVVACFDRDGAIVNDVGDMVSMEAVGIAVGATLRVGAAVKF